MGRTHRLKTWPEPYEAILDGRKTFEVRTNDRGFAQGDELILEEWDPTPIHYLSRNGYTGRKCRVVVTYMLPGGQFGLPAHLCVMSICRHVDPGTEVA